MLLFSLFAMNYVKPSRGSYNNAAEINQYDPSYLYYWEQYSSTATEVTTTGGSSVSGVLGTGPVIGSQCLVWNAGYLYYWQQYSPTVTEVTASGLPVGNVQGAGPAIGSQCLVWNAGNLYYWTQYASTVTEVTTIGGSPISNVQGAGPVIGSQCLVWSGTGPLPGVGGVLIPVDKLSLLAPYIGLTSIILVASVASAIYVKRVKRRKEKQ